MLFFYNKLLIVFKQYLLYILCIIFLFLHFSCLYLINSQEHVFYLLSKNYFILKTNRHYNIYFSSCNVYSYQQQFFKMPNSTQLKNQSTICGMSMRGRPIYLTDDLLPLHWYCVVRKKAADPMQLQCVCCERLDQENSCKSHLLSICIAESAYIRKR